MEVNTAYWGEPLAEYWGYNERTGATDLTDLDFDYYPPFIRNNMNPDYVDPLATTFTYTLRAAIYKEGGSEFEPNEELPDYSVAYIGVQNPDMPQCDIACLGLEEMASSGSTRADECFITDRDKVAPIAFLSNRPMRSYRSVSSYTIPTMEFYNFLAESSRGIPINGLRAYSPKFRDDGTWATRNTSFDCAYWRSLGLRTFFGVIYVKYCDYARNPSTGFPTKYDYSPVTLHWYEQQTLEWREAHPICQAWLRMCIRRTTQGLYDFSHNPGDGIMPDLTQGIQVNPLYFPTAAPFDFKFCAPAVMFGDGNDFTDWPLFGHLNRNTPLGQFAANSSSGGAASGAYAMFVGYHFGSLQHGGIDGTGANARTVWLIYEDHNDYEWFRQGAAAYGVFFTDGDTNDTGYEDLFAAGNDTYRWVNEKMCLGTVEEGGVTRGRYTRGTKNPTNRNFDWKTTEENDFDPAHPPGLPNEYSTTTVFNDISDVATLTRRYALTKSNVETLGHELWQISYDIINSIQNDEWNKYSAEILDTFLTNNPIDCIVSLEKYPMTIPKQSGPVTLKLGKAATSITCNITTATTQTYYFNPVPIQPCYGDSFLDYEPYTHFELYVPFCGTVDLNPRDILGRNLSVNLVVDFTTGTCVAYVLSDSLVIETINGKLSLSIPVTGIDSTTIASQITNGILNTRNARYQHEFSTLSKFATPTGILSNISNVFGSANTILQSETEARKAEYDLTHQQAAPHIIGSASPVGSWAIDFRCRLLIYYPTGEVIDNSKPTMKFDNEKFQAYAETIGFACAEPGTPAAYRGLLQATSPRLENMRTNNGTRIATADELQMIQEALASGIIVL